MSSLPGYTVIKKASQTLAERNDTAIDKFEIFDMKNMSRTELLIENKDPNTTIKAKKKNKKPKEENNLNDGQERITENNIVHITQPIAAPIVETKELLFITPYTEITVDCIEYYIDESIISVITSSNDRVKVRPERGAKLFVVIDDIKYEIYSSGLYIPIKNLDSILSIFFIMDETLES